MLKQEVATDMNMKDLYRQGLSIVRTVQNNIDSLIQKGMLK